MIPPTMPMPMRPLSADEIAAAAAAAYTDRYLSGMGVPEVIDIAKRAMDEALALAGRGEVGRAANRAAFSRAALNMARDAVAAIGTTVAVGVERSREGRG
jgi:hypothetical protein